MRVIKIKKSLIHFFQNIDFNRPFQFHVIVYVDAKLHASASPVVAYKNAFQ